MERVAIVSLIVLCFGIGWMWTDVVLRTGQRRKWKKGSENEKSHQIRKSSTSNRVLPGVSKK